MGFAVEVFIFLRAGSFSGKPFPMDWECLLKFFFKHAW